MSDQGEEGIRSPSPSPSSSEDEQEMLLTQDLFKSDNEEESNEEELFESEELIVVKDESSAEHDTLPVQRACSVSTLADDTASAAQIAPQAVVQLAADHLVDWHFDLFYLTEDLVPGNEEQFTITLPAATPAHEVVALVTEKALSTLRRSTLWSVLPVRESEWRPSLRSKVVLTKTSKVLDPAIPIEDDSRERLATQLKDYARAASPQQTHQINSPIVILFAHALFCLLEKVDGHDRMITDYLKSFADRPRHRKQSARLQASLKD